MALVGPIDIKPPENFIAKLQEHNKFIDHIPRIRGYPFDLQSLYDEVVRRGGYKHVTRTNQWSSVACTIGFKKHGPNVACAIRELYVRYLESYERTNLPSLQTVNTQDNQDYEFYTPSFQRPFRVPRRDEILPSCRFGNLDIDLVEKSLLSYLPNEVDCALNSLVVLSSMPGALKLSMYPRLTGILVSLTGVCQNDQCCPPYTSYKHSNSLLNFWSAHLSPKGLLYFQESFEECSKLLPFSFETEAEIPLFSLQHDYSLEIYKIESLLIIFRNICLNDCDGVDAAFLSRNPCLLRFFFTSAYCNLGDLKRLAFDCLVALHLPLTQECYASVYIDFATDLLFSQDREELLTGLKLILSICEEPVNLGGDHFHRTFVCLHSLSGYRNEAFIINLLSDKVTKRILETVFLPDLHLVITACDLIYFLTCVAQSLCAKLVFNGALDYLLPILQIEAQSFGVNSMYRLKVMQPPEPEAPLVLPLSTNYDIDRQNPKTEYLRQALDLGIDPQYSFKCEPVELSNPSSPISPKTNGFIKQDQNTDNDDDDDDDDSGVVNGTVGSSSSSTTLEKLEPKLNGFLSPNLNSGTLTGCQFSEDSNHSSSTQSSIPSTHQPVCNGAANYGNNTPKSPNKSRSNPTPVVTFKYEKDPLAPNDPDQYPNYWLVKYLEQAPGSTVSRTQIYAEYQAAHKIQFPGIKSMPWNSFILIMRASFPFTLDQIRVKNHFGNNEIHFKKLRFKRDAPQEEHITKNGIHDSLINGGQTNLPCTTNLQINQKQSVNELMLCCDNNLNPIFGQQNSYVQANAQLIQTSNGSQMILVNGNVSATFPTPTSACTSPTKFHQNGTLENDQPCQKTKRRPSDPLLQTAPIVKRIVTNHPSSSTPMVIVSASDTPTFSNVTFQSNQTVVPRASGPISPVFHQNVVSNPGIYIPRPSNASQGQTIVLTPQGTAMLGSMIPNNGSFIPSNPASIQMAPTHCNNILRSVVPNANTTILTQQALTSQPFILQTGSQLMPPVVPSQAPVKSMNISTPLMSLISGSSTSVSSQLKSSSSTPTTNSTSISYCCRWLSCIENFANIQDLSSHVYNEHYFPIKSTSLVQCLWRGCPDALILRNPLSLLSHLSDRHYSTSEIHSMSIPPTAEQVAINTCESRFQQNSIVSFVPSGAICNVPNPLVSSAASPGTQLFMQGTVFVRPQTSAVQSSTINFQSPASLQTTSNSNILYQNSINSQINKCDIDNDEEGFVTLSRRIIEESTAETFAKQYAEENNTYLQSNREGPVTKHLRYTAALILRNLLTHCSSDIIWHLRSYEELLTGMAFSRSESSQVILDCLRIMSDNGKS